LKPDFKTIADFRSDNRAAFKKVFRDFVILCRRLDLFGRELLAVDGTRIRRSITKTGILPRDRCKNSSPLPTRSWKII
jgi:transposase